MSGDSAHNVLRDREDLGLPAISGDIQVESEKSSYILRARTDGPEWLRIVLDDLQRRPGQSSSGNRSGTHAANSRLSNWRSLSGLDGKRDEYAIQISGGVTDGQVDVTELWTSKKIAIRLELAGGSAPSRFSHIIKGLVEIPIYEILSAEIAEGICASSSTSVHQMS